ncbi:MAG TPA: ATP-binding protein [Albitalea sp.]
MPRSRILPPAASPEAARRTHRFALCCALGYAALAVLWVMLFMGVASGWGQGSVPPSQLYLVRGLALVALTAGLVYVAALCAARHLGRHETLLRQREQQLAGIVDTAMDAIITVDAAHRIVVFNRSAAEVFRIPAEQAIGQPLDRFVPMRQQAAHREHVKRFAESGATSRRMGRLHVLAGLRADGEEFPMEASLSRMGEGEDVLMTVVLRDATEQREGEKAREAQLAAEAANLAKTQFLAHMSHELRTPLNAILGFSQLLLTRPDCPLGEAEAQQVQHIREAGWHLLALVNDVLDVSRIESGTLQLDSRGVELHPLLDEAWQLSEDEAQQHGVTMQAAYRDVPRVAAWCDALRLRQVVLNLLSNAIKYNRPGGLVRLDLEHDSSSVRLLLSDTGLGMTQEQLAHLYEPFNRLGRERGGVEGTGIGLALTRQLVMLMNGDMHIESVAGEGTCVRVELPRSQVPAKLPEPPPAPPSTPPSADELPVVLYIEDNPVNMLVVEQLLVRWPIARLAQAEDGASGLREARRLQPALILLDMRLPDMTGLELLAALRADPQTAGLRVVALSASAMTADVALARDAGAAAYWTKPLQFDQFLHDMQGQLQASARVHQGNTANADLDDS